MDEFGLDTDLPLQHGMRGLSKAPDAVNTLFFHPRNVESLHVSVRYVVYRRTSQVIDRQSDTELVAVMRQVYESEEPRIDPYADAVRQVRDLNAKVVEFASKEIAGSISQHLWYLNDISKPVAVPEPHSRGVFMSSKGSRSLEYPHRGA